VDPVVVMVGRSNEGVSDIEVMPDVQAEHLADAIAAAFGWEGTYDIQINGKLLNNEQTLADMDAWDGSELLLVVSHRLPRANTQSKPPNFYRDLQTPIQTQILRSQALDQKSLENDNRSRDSATQEGRVVPEPHTYTLLSSPKTKKPLNMMDQSETSDPQP